MWSGAAPSLNGPRAGDGSFERARVLLGRACRRDDAVACFGLGMLFAEGRDGPRDAQRGEALIARACASGVADACVQRGGERALAADADARAEGLAAFRAGCAADVYACAPLGVLLASGLAGRPDVDGACRHFTDACAAGARRACRPRNQLCRPR